MDPLHLAIALGPLAIYFLLLGSINLSSRPMVTTGPRDFAALGIGISGLVIAGPMELFMPAAAAARYGGVVWLVLLAFYVACLTLVALAMRPRLVIYNVAIDELRPVLAKVIGKLDPEARWVGESLVLPRLGVQLHLEPFNALRNVQLVSTGPQQSFFGWRVLEQELSATLREMEGSRNPYGVTLVCFGSLMLSVVTYMTIANRLAVAMALREMLRL